MRAFPWATMLLLAGLLVGCRSGPKAPLAPSTTRGPVSAPPSREPEPDDRAALQTTRTTGNGSGILAGQVIDNYDRRSPHATIVVVAAAEDGTRAAPIDTVADGQGYFKIPGLDPKLSYRLEAKTQEGTRIFYGSKTARPPDARLLLRVSDELTPPPGSLVQGPQPKATERKPAVSSNDEPVSVLERPSAPSVTAPAPLASPPAPVATPPRRRPPGPMDAEIRGPRDTGSPIPPAPPISEASPATPPVVTPSTPPASPSPPALTSAPSPVPSCVLVGRRLDNFALHDVSGQPWEFRRDRKGKVVLLDFWHTQCPPCLQAIKHLNSLQERFGRDGLEVVGIAYEPGTLSPTEQAQRVMAARVRYHIGYRTLLGSNTEPATPCPVQTQFGVRAFPTLKLIDQSGEVVWEAEGLTERGRWELEQEIRRRLR